MRDSDKYARLQAFGAALPKLRKQLEAQIAEPGFTREKVLATVVMLLDATLIRVGNTQYARENKSYGLTTLRNRHVDIKGSEIQFQFRGKSGVEHQVSVKDRRLARVVKRCMELPGQNLFQYLDEDGERHTVSSQDVNDYLHRLTLADHEQAQATSDGTESEKEKEVEHLEVLDMMSRESAEGEIAE